METSANIKKILDVTTSVIADDAKKSPMVRPVTPAPEEKLKFPCAPGQRRFWLLHQLNPRNPSSNIAVRWRLQGAVSNAELEQAFRIIMARHRVLRTFFSETDGDIVQNVEPQVAFHIPIVDLTALPEAEALIEAERAAQMEARTPFDLSSAPLMRVTHLRMGKDTSILLVTLHHIVSDAYSVAILARELSEIGAALQRGRLPRLPNLPVSYGDFSARQTQQRVLSDRQADADFWKHSLQGFRYFEIKTDHARPPMLTANSHIVSINSGHELIDELMRLGGQNGANLHVTLLAALFTLLHRYTGETDIAIGSQFAGRDDAAVENLIGLFCNPVLMRNDLSGDPSFLALLERVRANFADVAKHQRITQEDLIKIVKPKTDLSRHPLFSVNFMFQQCVNVNHCADFKLIELPPYSAGAICDLNLSAIASAEGWRLSCEYNLDLFETRTVLRFLNHLTILLRSLCLDPARKISALTIIDDIERRELLVENNRTSVIYPKHLTLPQLFEAQAKRTPDAVAVICAEHSMSFRELDAASNRLAHELRRRGVEPGNRVAIFLDRSPQMMVALLAVLKSGCAYIPLDPAYPIERLQHIFENSRPAGIITRAVLRERLTHEAMAVILIDTQALLIAKQSDQPLIPAPAPTDLAYVIYTSGSTGRPKGVTIHHRALVNLLFAMRQQPGLSKDDAVVAVTTVSFDIAALDLFLPLIVGAKLILAQESEITDGAALSALLQRHQATFMQATPVTWQLLLEAGWRGNPPLKMLCGGEALPRKLAEKLLQCGGELWNMYGPTETTIWSSVARVESGEGPVALGPPIANTQFYVVDGHQELAPQGVPGELLIGGDGVSLGYFGLPEVTAEKFIPDKFRKLPGAKLYRTGDIVRRQQNGFLEYLGRSDHQVKLRGFRIELGDIEAALLRYPGIQEAVAILGRDASGENAIWAYVTPSTSGADADALTAALRASLMQCLPSYMRPSSIVVLDVLPRTPNGKVDRRALPAATAVIPVAKETTPPLNDVERRLAEIWNSVLGLKSVEKTADFFEMGGHSLLAARLLARIEAEFGQRLSLLTLFKAPNIEAQAKMLMQSQQREYDFRQVVRLQPNGSKPPLIAIHNTGVYYYNLSRRLGADQPLTALQLFDPSIERQSLPHTLEEIAAEYVRLIRQFQAAGPYRLIGWCVGGVLAFEVARQLVTRGEEVSLLAMIDAWAPGHNQRLPRWRALLADYSYRWQLIGLDWRRVLNREQTLAAFVKQRVLFKKIQRWFGAAAHIAPEPIGLHGKNLSAENYDQRLLAYLEQMAQNYEPRLYPGKITLLCSAQEPKGWFLDPQMGWSAFALGGVEVTVIDGDHFTVFKGAGLEQMATHIARAMDVQRVKRHPPLCA